MRRSVVGVVSASGRRNRSRHSSICSPMTLRLVTARMRGEFQKERHPSATERQNACQLFVGKEDEDETLELSSMTYPPACRDIAMSGSAMYAERLSGWRERHNPPLCTVVRDGSLKSCH